MHKKALIVISVALCLFPGVIYADDDTFILINSFECSVSSGSNLYKCGNDGDIPFVRGDVKIEFGDSPQVVVWGCAQGGGVCVGLDDYSISNWSPQGFHFELPKMSGETGAKIHLYYIAQGPKLRRGTAQAKYLVLTVVYAPPGANGGRGASSVKYAVGSTTGTTTSGSQSFKNANTVSFEGSGGL